MRKLSLDAFTALDETPSHFYQSLVWLAGEWPVNRSVIFGKISWPTMPREAITRADPESFGFRWRGPMPPDILLSSFHLKVDGLLDFPVSFSTIHRTLTALRCFVTEVCYLPSLESTVDLSRSSLEVRLFGQTVCLNVYSSTTTGCGSLGFSVAYLATAIAANKTWRLSLTLSTVVLAL